MYEFESLWNTKTYLDLGSSIEMQYILIKIHIYLKNNLCADRLLGENDINQIFRRDQHACFHIELSLVNEIPTRNMFVTGEYSFNHCFIFFNLMRQENLFRKRLPQIAMQWSSVDSTWWFTNAIDHTEETRADYRCPYPPVGLHGWTTSGTHFTNRLWAQNSNRVHFL